MAYSYTFDDGSTIGEDAFGNYVATPAERDAIVQGATGSGSTGFLDILDQISSVGTSVSKTIITLQGQQDSIAIARAANDLERYKTLAAVTIGKSKTDIAIAQAQRDVAIAKQNLAGVGPGGDLFMLLALGGLAFAIAST